MASTIGPHRPPTEESDEATPEQLRLARQQGEAFGRALFHMIEEEAHGREAAAGEYLVGFAVERAEGLHAWDGNALRWSDPGRANAHIEVSVRDGADGRFVPGLDVTVTVIAPDGRKLGPHVQPFLWHPWLFHYGRNWELPGDGEYTLQIHIDPPRWQRHDLKNGCRFTGAVDVQFERVRIDTGRKLSR